MEDTGRPVEEDGHCFEADAGDGLEADVDNLGENWDDAFREEDFWGLNEDVGGLGDDEVNEEDKYGLEEAVGVEEDEGGFGEEVGGFGDDEFSLDEAWGGLEDETILDVLV